MERTLWIAVRRALLMIKTDLSPNGQRAAQLVIDAIGAVYPKPKRAPSRRIDDTPAPR